jgi:hypothetical protein
MPRRTFWMGAAVILMVAGIASPGTTRADGQAERAKAAFDRFKALEGAWRGESTRGWSEELRYRVIAGGSVVMQTSFDAHPGETMATMFYLNGEELELTHYCIAKNQPHLRATKFENGGRTVTFTFLDGGNLPSRDQGHMDRAVFRFEDADHLSSRWTWYEGGEERWMEDIRLVRRR